MTMATNTAYLPVTVPLRARKIYMLHTLKTIGDNGQGTIECLNFIYIVSLFLK